LQPGQPPAWLHRIQKNQFIPEIRGNRPSCGIDDAPEAAFPV
jgi:DNA-directed RNA polymerase specialized sigma24 family protein